MEEFVKGFSYLEQGLQSKSNKYSIYISNGTGEGNAYYDNTMIIVVVKTKSFTKTISVIHIFYIYKCLSLLSIYLKTTCLDN